MAGRRCVAGRSKASAWLAGTGDTRYDTLVAPTTASCRSDQVGGWGADVLFVARSSARVVLFRRGFHLKLAVRAREPAN